MNGDIFGTGTTTALDVLQGDPSRVRDLAVGFGSLRTIRAEASATGPEVVGDLRLVDGRLQGTITNRSAGDPGGRRGRRRLVGGPARRHRAGRDARRSTSRRRQRRQPDSLSDASSGRMNWDGIGAGRGPASGRSSGAPSSTRSRSTR